MLKHITVPIRVDDHEPEKCGNSCLYRDEYFECCHLFAKLFFGSSYMRCKECLEGAK